MNSHKPQHYLVFIFLLTLGVLVNAQSRKFDIHTIAFYNVENLFDTIDDRYKYDNDFTPNGSHRYTSKIYWERIGKISKVLASIGGAENPNSPVIIGLCEVETREVLTDLINHPSLRNKHYGIVHYDSPDERGIDVALLYQKKHFKKLKHQVYTPQLFDMNGQRDFTRDQLVVSGQLDGESMHFIVNHWPSRRGGSLKSEPKRILSARLNLRLIDSILELDPVGKILVMGDFNDDPNSKSINKILKASSKLPESTTVYGLFNPMAQMHKLGYHSLVYRDNLNLFDQMIMTVSFTKKDYSSYRFFKAGIHNKDFLTQQFGRFQGYPYRSYNQGNYTGGYSDHFPVYVYLIRESR